MSNGLNKAPAISVLICTHNPSLSNLRKTLSALEQQRPLSGDQAWELVIVDNSSSPALASRSDVQWPPHTRIVEEPKLGLTHARKAAFHASRADILIYVDDDNVLESNYLNNAMAIMRENEYLAAIGGRVLPEYETDPPDWFRLTGISLACRDLGPSAIEASWTGVSPDKRTYPPAAPIGAGMVLRRSAYAEYIRQVDTDEARLALGRRGADLASGEDNDMVMTLLAAGWSVSYRPELLIHHIIPASRVTQDYLKRYAYASNRTWVQVLSVHGIIPWSPVNRITAPLRKLNAAIRMKPWKGPVESIQFSGACGLIDGRAKIS